MFLHLKRLKRAERSALNYFKKKSSLFIRRTFEWIKEEDGLEDIDPREIYF